MTKASDIAKIVAYSYTKLVYDFGAKNSAARALVQSLGRRTDGNLQKGIFIPGSDNIACWLADFDAVATNGLFHRLGSLHRGIDEAAEAISGQVVAEQADFLAGHSEGAAIALRIAGDCCLDGKPPKVVYAFEPPQLCADDKLAEVLWEHGVDVRVYWHGRDVVPMVPRLLEDWRHPAKPIKFKSALWFDAVPVPNIEDHLLNVGYYHDLDVAGL